MVNCSNCGVEARLRPRPYDDVVADAEQGTDIEQRTEGKRLRWRENKTAVALAQDYAPKMGLLNLIHFAPPPKSLKLNLVARLESYSHLTMTENSHV